MQLNFKNLPIGSLPYNDIQLCKNMMLRLYENIPYLAELPLIDANDNVLYKTFNNVPNIKIKDGVLMLPEDEDESIIKIIPKLDKLYNSFDPSDFTNYITETPYFYIYSEMLKKLKPKYTVINLVGPFSFASLIFNRNQNAV